MSRLLLSRIAALSLLVLVAALALAVWQAHRDIEDEALGARQSAHLLGALGGLQGTGPADVAARLDQVRAIVGSGELRHLRVRVRDADGSDVVASPRGAEPPLQSWLFSLVAGTAPDAAPVHWTLRAADGRHFDVEMQVDPQSERAEALQGMVDLLTVLFVFGVLIVLAAYVTLRQTLSPLRGILDAIDGYRRQDFEQRAPLGRSEEMNAIAEGLNHLAGELAEAQEARRTLSARLLTLQEEERAHLARELHDEFGQVLTAMRADATWLARRVHDQPDLQAVANALLAHCERASLDVRDLLRRLRPALHDGGGSVPLWCMLEELAASWRARPGQAMAIRLELDVDADALPEPLALTMYRLSQEALTNAARHAGATRIHISVLRAGHEVLWEASDDGIGMPAADDAVRQGGGLVGMRERVWSHGGEIAFAHAEPAARRGLRVQARIPVTDGAPPVTGVAGAVLLPH